MPANDPVSQLAYWSDRLGKNHQDAEAWCQIGFIYLKLCQLDDALSFFQTARAIAPRLSDAWFGEFITHFQQWHLTEAETALNQAMTLAPANQALWSGKAYFIAATHGTPEAVLAAYQAWADKFANPLKALPPRPAKNHGRIRLGYVSGDLREHALLRFFAPVLRHHDRTQFEIHAFSTGPEDSATTALKPQFDVWHSAASDTPEALARRIRAAEIDILIDLSGHTEGSRLLTFAQRPAPVQITWYGFNCTTGMSAMDYRITDSHMDPPSNEAWSVEKLLRLPAFACFEAPAGTPEVGPLPALSQGGITFASLNNAQKISDQSLALWGRILAQRPDARLILIGPYTPENQAAGELALRKRIRALGLPEAQVELSPRLDPAGFAALCQRVDIALEPFPFTGAVTTAHGLWLGLPVITLAGVLPFQRAATAILAAANMADGVATDLDDYVAKALALAADIPALAEIRRGLRDQLIASPLCQYAEHTQALEAHLLTLWQNARAEAPATK